MFLWSFNGMFIRQLSQVFNLQENYILNLSVEDSRSHVSNATQANHCVSVLKT